MKLIDSIMIQAYLKKYLEYHHSTDPFLLTEKNRFGSYLISKLRFKAKAEEENNPPLRKAKRKGVPVPAPVQRPERSLNIHKRYMNAVLDIAIPEHYWICYGSVITPRGQERFNNFLLDEFQDRMVDFVSPGVKRKGDLNMMLLTFREKYDISEDELSLKTLQKMWEREKHRAIRCKSA